MSVGCVCVCIRCARTPLNIRVCNGINTHFRRKSFLSDDYLVLFMKKETYIIVNKKEDEKKIINSRSSGRQHFLKTSKQRKECYGMLNQPHFRWDCALWKLTDATWKCIALHSWLNTNATSNSENINDNNSCSTPSVAINR